MIDGGTEALDLQGRILDRTYRVQGCLGLGGTGVVLDARRVRDGESVVIKTLRRNYRRNWDVARRLRREAEIARLMNHPGIAAVLDTGSLPDGAPYLVMERLEGESLSHLLLRTGSLRTDHVAAIAIRVAAILHRVHRLGYVHRDIKPEHIILNRLVTGDLDVRLLDFGVCTHSETTREERKREEGRVFGTPSYVSPEQASGNPDVDGRADLFSLGVVMFEAMSGRLPFISDDVTSLLRRIIREDAPRVGLIAPGIPVGLDAVVARAMARRRENRFPSARAFAEALVPYVGQRRALERRIATSLDTGFLSQHQADTVRYDESGAAKVTAA